MIFAFAYRSVPVQYSMCVCVRETDGVNVAEGAYKCVCETVYVCVAVHISVYLCVYKWSVQIKESRARLASK